MKANTLHRLLVRPRPQQRSRADVSSVFRHWNHQRLTGLCTSTIVPHPPPAGVGTFSTIESYNVTYRSKSSLPASQNSKENLSVSLIDFNAAAKIDGEESHVATIVLQPGETLRAESGSMIYMTEGIAMDTKLNGVTSAFNRMLTGQNVFLTDFHYEGRAGTSGTVCLGTDFPSKILRFHLPDHPHHTLICQKGAYMASNPNVSIDIEFTKTLTAGFFGGQGFVLQKISGDSDVLVKGGGTIVRKELRDGETLRVTSGSIVCFESTIAYDVQMVPGIKNVMFGGEGLFVTTLQGPGQVWLQGMPPDRMIAEIARRVPSGGGIGFGIPIPLGGGSGGDSTGGVTGTDEAAAGVATGIGAESATMAASEAAIDADRAATVASSGVGSSSNIDADSPTALFGDAVTKADPLTSTDDVVGSNTESWDTESDQEPSFDDSSSSFSTENIESNFEEVYSFDDSSEASNDAINDGELFDDTEAASSVVESVASESQSFFRQIWDFFSDQD